MSSTPLASKTTISSRSKMAQLNIKSYHKTITTTGIGATTTKAASKLPPKTATKPAVSRTERAGPKLAATSSRIALPRSRLTGSGAGLPPPPPLSSLHRPVNRNNGTTDTNGATHRVAASRNGISNSRVPSFADSRSSSKVSSVTSISNNNNNNIDQTRQLSIPPAQSVIKQHTATSTYIPDTNVIRKGLAKFSNPIECQRQFQALNSEIRQLKETNVDNEEKISRLQDQLKDSVNLGVGYATVVQYFAKKLKLDSEIDLENECERLKDRVNELMLNEKEYESKLESLVDDYKSHLQVERDLKADLERELDETRTTHSEELLRLREVHNSEIDDLEEKHLNIENESNCRVKRLESELDSRTKDLTELRKEHESLNSNYNKLEESLTKDKDARVKYAQEKINQLQKDVDSLNSVLEMRTERIHALERDSILLGEAQQELVTMKDHNKALKQQLESLNAALDNKREQYEHLLADHEKIVQELKRERKERRRMTMRTEQLEFVLNESCASESNVTVLEAGVRHLDSDHVA